MIDIAVFFGGCSSEYEVSLQSVCGVLGALDRRKYNVHMIWITRDGEWFYYEGDTADIAGDRRKSEKLAPVFLTQNRGRRELVVLRDGKSEKVHIDVAFPVLHGRNGEDGTLQGLLELAGVPVAGCGTLASALCMDKYRAHKLAEAEGIAAPKSTLISSGDNEETVQNAAKSIGFPLFVKPLRAGSSFGISRVNDLSQLAAAVKQALAYDDRAVLEECIDGVEVGCAVIGRDQLVTGEIDMITLKGGFFDYNEKYTLGTAQIQVPAKISKEQTEVVKSAAKRIYKALDCSGFARVDMFLTAQGELFFNEVNTIPGFTSHSRFPRMMEAAGFSMSEVVDMIIGGALK